MKKWIFSLVLAMGSMAFAAGELKIEVSPSSPYVLPVAMKTCSEQNNHSENSSVTANAFEFNRFAFTWNSPDTDFELVFVQVMAESQDLENSPYACVIADENLDETLFPSSRHVSAGSTIVDSGCAIRCGGIRIKPDVKYSNIPVAVTAFGVEVRADGEVVPVEAQVEASVQYKKAGY
ncbi:MAG: hypothetical protein ACAH59_10970 [Pseudobdellovibrionaceae bacterium]